MNNPVWSLGFKRQGKSTRLKWISYSFAQCRVMCGHFINADLDTPYNKWYYGVSIQLISYSVHYSQGQIAHTSIPIFHVRPWKPLWSSRLLQRQMLYSIVRTLCDTLDGARCTHMWYITNSLDPISHDRSISFFLDSDGSCTRSA